MPTKLDDLAIFGGAALFQTPRPLGQLFTPDVEDYLPLLREALGAQSLSGNGEIVRRLEGRLAEFHGVHHCVAVANACAALMMLMRVFAAGRKGEVVIPAFSYRGLPHLTQWAGQVPRFCEVDERTHVLDVRSLATAINEATTSVLVVTNFNGPGDLDGLCDIAASRGVPLLIDSVEAVGATYNGRPLGSFGRAEVFSLHATKLLNGFEGGYVTTNDLALAERLRRERDSGLNLNVKLNEIHAALGYLSLECFDTIVSRNRARFESYRAICARLPGLNLLPYIGPDPDRWNYRMAVAEVRTPWPISRDQTVSLMRAEGALMMPYYSPPLHHSVHAPAGCVVPSLPITEMLSSRFAQFPVGECVSLKDIEKIGDVLEFVRDNGHAISDRLQTTGV